MRFSVGSDLEFGMNGGYTNGTSKIEGSMTWLGTEWDMEFLFFYTVAHEA